MQIPAGYEDDLSGYGPVSYDGYCGEPVAWGFEIRRHLGDVRFRALQEFGALECINHSLNSRWALITKRLTAAEALAKYGPVTNLELGPRGGFRSVTYGAKKFLSRCVRPGT